ncbi:hypothetical protein OHA27_19770 [Streptomyces sp. NBC_01619]|uniref:hypothetical protein n=1 Tax=Streptomyces sp. NBC_01619 TaxID=2975901 RepID=UPI0022599918|nr:hypothetical protein [Streptomyces sp. NBC_01619]MCX4512499.1 hypothetical protein [Streptomyces sp. NBC_01619]
MGDVLLVLCIPLTVCASGVYAVCDSWWRRRRRVAAPSSHARPGLRPDAWPYAYPYAHTGAHAGARRAEREMLVAAEEIVDEAYARLAGLYDGTCADGGCGEGVCPGDRVCADGVRTCDQESADAHAVVGAHVSGVGGLNGTSGTSGTGGISGISGISADSSPDRDPSSPAPARTRTRPPAP